MIIALEENTGYRWGEYLRKSYANTNTVETGVVKVTRHAFIRSERMKFRFWVDFSLYVKPSPVCFIRDGLVVIVA